MFGCRSPASPFPPVGKCMSDKGGICLCNHAFLSKMNFACSLETMVDDSDLEGWWFKPQCSHAKLHAAVWALTTHCFRGDSPLRSQINSKLFWITASAK